MSQLAKDSKNSKDTVYVDPEDEITSIIDKVEASKKNIVALVLPKRSTALQSTVNMRLLKRSADSSKKRLVLITNEPGLLPLAGAIGLHTAKNLNSKPVIPPAPEVSETVSELNAEDVPAVSEIDSTKSVGELNGDEPDAIEIDNSDGKTDKNKVTDPKSKKDKKLKVPDFDRFRVLLLAGVFGAIALVVFLLYAFVFAPKAQVVIKADSTQVTANLTATTSDKITATDNEKMIVPAELKELKQSGNETVPATGQKDLGTKATGTIEVTNCEDTNSRNLSTGATFARNGKNYLSTESVVVPAGSFSGGGSICNSSGVDVDVRATEAGEGYNQAGGTYTSSSAALQGNFDLVGSAMSGGTSKITKVVSNQDVDNAKQKIGPKLQTEAENFQKQLEEQGYLVLNETATTTEPKVTANPGVDQEATQTTVTQEQTFSVLVVKKDEMQRLLLTELNKQIDTKTQKINGDDLIDGAVIRVTEKKSPTEVTVTVQKTADAVPIFDEAALKEEIKGKKRGDIQDSLGKRPGVKDVTVTYSPFWVSTTPKASKKITIVIEPVNSDGTN